MKKLLITTIFSILIFSNIVEAQEYTTNLSQNGEIKEYQKNNNFISKNKNNKAVLELPFWDDFSDSHIYPKSELWANNLVYINSTLAPKPPSIGVATFDALNDKGEIYSHADYLTSFIADSLTSNAINLNYPGNNSIYLSFYYRPGGIGNNPEPEDSLMLEFYAADENSWTKVWSIAGSEDKEFEFVILPIDEEKYLKSGFKFRFTNYASFGSSTYPDLATNCDFWHLDYIYLNKDRNINDNVFHDVAFTKPLHSIVSGFESVPWSHYKNSSSHTIKDVVQSEIKNNDNINRIIDSLNLSLTDLTGSSGTQYFYDGTHFPRAGEFNSINISDFGFNFPENTNDTCDFLLKAKIVTNSLDSSQNNIIKYTQKFKDYYAYDDGSAEAGYGIYGSGTKYGSVACKFTPLAKDSIIGVEIYFTQAFNNGAQDYFWLNVWNEGNDNKPDTSIISIEGQLPQYTNFLDKFYYYEFPEAVELDKPFYIGWTQTTDKKLNIGFDYNIDTKDKRFFNFRGSWVQSKIEGSMMIRPVFKNTAVPIETVKIFTKENPVIIKPNPANISIEVLFDRKFETNYSVKIFDLKGTLIYSDNNFNEDNINISKFKRGMYFIRITDNKSEIYNSRFLVK